MMIGIEIMTGVDVSDVTTGLFEPGWGLLTLGVMGVIVLGIVIFLFRKMGEDGALPALFSVLIGFLVVFAINTTMDEEVNPSRAFEHVADYYGIQPEADFVVPDEGYTVTTQGVIIREADGSWSGPQDVTLTNDNGVVIALVLNESGKLVPLPPANS